MNTIWKIEIGIDAGNMLPKGAKPLSVHMQSGTPYMWLLVDPDAELEKRYFRAFGTGHDIPENIGAFIGTFLTLNDTFVFHVFEIIDASVKLESLTSVGENLNFSANPPKS